MSEAEKEVADGPAPAFVYCVDGELFCFPYATSGSSDPVRDRLQVQWGAKEMALREGWEGTPIEVGDHSNLGADFIDRFPLEQRSPAKKERPMTPERLSAIQRLERAEARSRVKAVVT